MAKLLVLGTALVALLGGVHAQGSRSCLDCTSGSGECKSADGHCFPASDWDGVCPDFLQDCGATEHEGPEPTLINPGACVNCACGSSGQCQSKEGFCFEASEFGGSCPPYLTTCGALLTLKPEPPSPPLCLNCKYGSGQCMSDQGFCFEASTFPGNVCPPDIPPCDVAEVTPSTMKPISTEAPDTCTGCVSGHGQCKTPDGFCFQISDYDDGVCPDYAPEC